mmetsp:Transcript_24214/g.77320  ORF Transcript_24214/g.77320 Transcript_24214/m.77320 type:complete len:226 (-) Transcript_24214:588-1265(-)
MATLSMETLLRILLVGSARSFFAKKEPATLSSLGVTPPISVAFGGLLSRARAPLEGGTFVHILVVVVELGRVLSLVLVRLTLIWIAVLGGNLSTLLRVAKVRRPVLERGARRGIKLAQVLQDDVGVLFEVGLCVHVAHAGVRCEVQLVVGAKVVVVLVPRDIILELLLVAQRNGSLIRPAPRNVPRRVATASEQNYGHAKGLDVFNSRAVALEREVPNPKAVPGD